MQIRELQSRLRHVKLSLEPLAANDLVRERVREVYKLLSSAEKQLTRLRSDSPIDTRSQRREAFNFLVSAGAEIQKPLELVADLATATAHAIPAIVDLPTLVRLGHQAAEIALGQVPARQYRPQVPVRAVEHILVALNRPTDAASRAAADKLQGKLRGAAFAALCEVVFQASGAAYGKGNAAKFAEGPIRRFKSTYAFDSARRTWYKVE